MTDDKKHTSSNNCKHKKNSNSNSYTQYMVLPIKNNQAGNDLFVGRDRFKTKLKQSISNAFSKKSHGGSFLVGGYRGVGKTHLVDTVVKEVVEQSEVESSSVKINDLRLDIGVDSDLSTRDILCDLVEIMYSRSLRSYRKVKVWSLFLLTLTFIALTGSTLYTTKAFNIKDFFTTGLSGFFQTYQANLIFYLACVVLLYVSAKLVYKNVFSRHRIIEELALASRFSREWDTTSGVALPSSRTPLFQSRRKLSQEPISARRIQQSLINYINKQRENSISYIITFDEVDKINPSTTENHKTNNKSRKQKVDELLGGLKALMNNSHCVFIVVAGREIVDAYYSESGYTSVLYESVFDDIFYIPTLLTDWSDGQSDCYSSMVRQYVNTVIFGSDSDNLDNLLENALKSGDYFKGLNDKKRQKITLDYLFYFEIFIKYLTLHSWGNFKRLKLMLNDHIEYYNRNMGARVNASGMPKVFTPIPNQKVLIFTPSDIRRMFVSARLYAMFDVNMGRSTSKTDDKAAVSGLITILDTFRFHSRGFSRAMIDRTIAGIDVHAESSLSYIADDYVHSTFQSMIRQTSNNIYPYRYYLSTDMEFSYFAKILGAKSSSFEFALDSAEPVREFYLREAKRQAPDGSLNSFLASAKLQAILGDIFVCEHRYDLASSSYSNTIYLLKKVLRTDNEEAWRENGGISLEAQYMLIRSLLKKGRLEEERENTTKAISLYHEAQKTAQIIFEVNNSVFVGKTTNKYLSDNLSNFNSEENTHHFLNQSIIAKLAINFANIKSGNFTKIDDYQKHYCMGDGNQSGIEHRHVFLSKYLTTAYFSGMYSESKDNEEVLKLVDSVIKENIDSPVLKSTASSILYIWGQSQFSTLANNLKKLAGMKENEKLAPYKFYRQWFVLVEYMLKLEGELSKFTRPTKIELSAHGDHPLMPKEKRNINLLIDSFIHIFKAADKSKKAGRYAEAAHQYTAILLNWIALLEIIPWKHLESNNKEYQALTERLTSEAFSELISRLKNRTDWLNDVIECAQDCVEKADKSSNIALRQGVLSRYTKLDISDNDKLHINTNTFRAYDVLESLSKDDIGNDEEYSTMVWCRSNISNYLLIFGIWENYCRYSIGSWISSTPEISFNFHIIPVPIGNQPRVHALYRWLSARFDMHLLRKKMQDISASTLTCEAKIEVIENIANIVEQLSEALDDYKKAFRSDDPDSFPSKTHIYFNLAELIDYVNTNSDLKDSDGKTIDFIDGALIKLKDRAQKNAEKFTPGTNNGSSYDEDTLPTMYLDKKYVELHLNKFRYDLLEIDNIQSLSYQRKLRHKYFLYDDFDDPFYIAEWAHLRMMSSSCRLLTIDKVEPTNALSKVEDSARE